MPSVKTFRISALVSSFSRHRHIRALLASSNQPTIGAFVPPSGPLENLRHAEARQVGGTCPLPSTLAFGHTERSDNFLGQQSVSVLY